MFQSDPAGKAVTPRASPSVAGAPGAGTAPCRSEVEKADVAAIGCTRGFEFRCNAIPTLIGCR